MTAAPAAVATTATATASLPTAADTAQTTALPTPAIRYFSDLQDYAATQTAMQNFIAHASGDAGDMDDICEELWVLQHPPVYTQGRAGKPHHHLRDNGIPVVRSDRGGQITYHAPGQLVVYLLVNIRRRGIGLRQLVCGVEQAIIAVLAGYGIPAHGRRDAPGVYVRAGGKNKNGDAGEEAKIAALGLRWRHGWVYHGTSLNVNMDLSPFTDINPCGYAGLPVTQVADCLPYAAARATDGLVSAITPQLATALQTMVVQQTHSKGAAR